LNQKTYTGTKFEINTVISDSDTNMWHCIATCHTKNLTHGIFFQFFLKFKKKITE